MSFNKNGNIVLPASEYTYLVPNFTDTKVSTGWTLGGSVNSSGIAVLSGTAPGFTSTTFSVGANDIVCFEFTVSVPTPSTTTSGPGIYIGTLGGQTVYQHSFNFSTDTWTKTTSTTTNPYFLNSYNSKASNYVKTYILGSSVDLKAVPSAERTNTSYAVYCIQLTSSYTSTNIRHGYNSNTSMVINISNPKIYKLNQNGMSDVAISSYACVGKGFINAPELVEY